MNRHLTRWILFMFVAMHPAIGADAVVDTNDAPLKILFIGNSHTFYHDLPRIVRRIAESKSLPVSVSQSTRGGYRLYQHADDASTLAMIASQPWDIVVLQEGIYGSLPVDLAEQQSYPFALELYDRIKANAAGALEGGEPTIVNSIIE